MHGRTRRPRNVAMCVVATAAIAAAAVGCGGSSGGGTTTAAGGTGQSAATTTQATSGATTSTPATTGTSTSTSGTTGGAAATVLSIEASPSELAFIPNTLSAPAGRIMIRMTNPSQLQHSVALAVAGVTPGAVVGYGGVSEVVATLAPGTYTYYCTVPGHRQAGMTGTLTVH